MVASGLEATIPAAKLSNGAKIGAYGAADPGFGQVEFHAVRRFDVASESRHHGPHLLEAGGHEERRRSAVALDADGVEARLRMCKLAVTMRAHRPAAVQIRVDERTQRLVGFEPGVEHVAAMERLAA